jgi:nucleoside-triphosphatase THEP1
VARRPADLLQADGLKVGGFVTGELREHGRRVGFAVETFHPGAWTFGGTFARKS